MDNIEREKQTRNRRECIIGSVYVTLLFVITTVVCCLCLFYYNSDEKTTARKEFTIAKMDRIRGFQDMQSDKMVVIDSIYNKIKVFDPGINAGYEENDIKFYLNDIKSIYDKNSYDDRYKIFDRISGFYRMWFDDKKELWSKQQNIVIFKKNLEDCEIGLQKKQEELKNTKK
ncbi:MAG: type VI secretion system transmembrane protein TssO [Candidatus Azobacteroides sp.]|nr:type VI secretion system transmembrane protein TssO [Candidatus Azobacteroides sp.]